LERRMNETAERIGGFSSPQPGDKSRRSDLVSHVLRLQVTTNSRGCLLRATF